MPMAQRNIIAGSGLLCFAVWYAYLTAGLPERAAIPGTPGPSFFPWLIISIIACLSAALLIRGIAASTGEGRWTLRYSPPGLPVAMLICFLAYLIVLPLAGFIVASIPFFAVLMWIYGCRHLIAIAASAVAVPLVLFAIFRHGFQIVLPSGVW